MRAVRMSAPRKMEIIEVPDPKIANGQVLVRLTEIAVCGSDLITYLGTQPREYPANLGKPAHECVGIVVESSLDGYRKGDRVLYFPPDEDGLCEYVVATNPIQLLKLPADGNISEWMIAQLLGTVIHAAKELGSVMSQRVAVIGQGPVGMLFDHLLWNLGARQIIAIDKVPERLAVSPKMHATHTLQVGKDDVVAAVQELTGGLGADLVVEAAGYEGSHELMLDLVRQDGRILMFGCPKNLTSTVDMYQWYRTRAKMITTWKPSVEDDIHVALEYIVQGRIDVKPILTHRFPLDRVNDAYGIFADRKDGAIKVIVEF